MTSRLTRVMLTLIAAWLSLALSACGGDGSPSMRVLLEADLSELPAELDSDAIMTILEQVLERRATEFGVDDVDIQREDPGRVSVTLRGLISEEDARQLLEQKARLEFRQPVLDEDGLVLCEAPEGAQFAISPGDITYVPESPDDRLAPRCVGNEGQSGAIVWEPVDASDGQGSADDPTTSIIQPLSATVDRSGAPIVIVTFFPESGVLFQKITTGLVGLPLGIFVDGELLAGPTVEAPVTTGNIVIAGLSLAKANILAAQLAAGELPVPVSEISVEGTAS